jgi:hypothetical protein
MTASILDNWTSVRNDLPDGTRTISAGSNRYAFLVVPGERGGGDYVFTTKNLGNVAPDYEAEYYDPTNNCFQKIFGWKESTIANDIEDNDLDFTDTVALPSFSWSFAVYQDVDQNDPLTLDQDFLTGINTSYTFTNGSGASDPWFVQVTRSSGNRNLDGWTGATEVFEQNAGCTRALATGTGDTDPSVALDGSAADLSYLFATVNPVSAPPAQDLTITGVGPGGQDIIYEGEIRVRVTGEDFSASGNSVFIHSSDPGAGTPAVSVEQTIMDEDTTYVDIEEVDKGAISSNTAYLEVRNSGETETGVIQIVLRDKPDNGTVVVRSQPDDVEAYDDQTPITDIDMSLHFYATDAQDSLSFSDDGDFPAGITMSSDGFISGTIGSSADSGSPYTPVITATDEDGNTAQAGFEWVINNPAPPPPTPPEMDLVRAAVRVLVRELLE